jgi:hypothetical protein
MTNRVAGLAIRSTINAALKTIALLISGACPTLAPI